MSWDQLFGLTNAVALIGWLILAVLPRKPLALSAVLYLCVGLLCLVYFAAFVALFGGLADPVRIPGAAEPDLLDYSIAGLRPLFMSDGGVVIAWTHYLGFDLFVGLWIARDAWTQARRSLNSPPLNLWYYAAALLSLFAGLAAGESMARHVLCVLSNAVEGAEDDAEAGAGDLRGG